MKHINDYNRKLFFDYHMSGTVKEIGEAFDAVKWAEQLEKANVEVVSVFVICGFGYRYYRKGKHGIIHPSLPEGMDVVEDTIRECHKRGIKVIGYSHTWGSEYHRLNFPEACRSDINGNVRTKELCGNNPVFEEVILPQITEVTSNYDLDGFFFDCIFAEEARVCHCKYCRERFKKDTGYDNIPTSKEDESYEAYIKWFNNRFEQFRKEVADAVHKGNPDMPFSANWAYTARNPLDVPEYVGFLVQDCFPQNILASEQLQAKNWALSEKPFSLMNNMSLQWWMAYDIKPYESLVQEVMEIMVNGGKPWMGFQMYQNLSTHPEVMNTVGDVFGYVKKVEKAFENKKVLPYIGALHSESQLVNRRDKALYCPNADTTSLFGLNKALTRSSIPYNSVTERIFEKNLQHFKTVIISNNQYVSDELYAKLKGYVSGGGKLFITGKSGLVDMKGNVVFNNDFTELTGIEPIEESPYSYAYINPLNEILSENTAQMPVLVAEKCMYVKEKSADVVANVINPYNKTENVEINWGDYPSFSNPFRQTDYPAVTVNKYGKGKVCYCAFDIFRGYIGTNNWSAGNIIKNIINKILLCEDAICISAPSCIEMTLMKDAETGNLLINLLNTMRSTPAREVGNRFENAICEDIVPVCNIEISMTTDSAPSCIKCVYSGETIDFEWIKNKLVFNVPKVEIYEGLEIIF